MDEELIKQIQNDDIAAYKQLFIKYYSPLCEYASQFITDMETEELVQDLMLFVWENRKQLMITQSVKSYLFTSIKFRCLNAIRDKQYHSQVHSIIYEKLKDQFDDPDYYLANELAENIEKAIEQLPETYKETFLLSRWSDQTNAQIASQLSVSVKTVEYRISQSLKILRKRLKDYLPFFLFFLRI
ncbi:RNA polymerase sigma-70 factor [Parabacteroides sp. Marseille-P3160]|uniref:RNA polymerase sigma-70 factor n=1 Tax=Parabacteroides sp. Marseille-P3160 TaxID=1917887 RepID=UPI0009B9E2E2|nr:RNA polymerase sigma-70 factor [Parabacteroides sp. Marseille-P3160]